MTDKIIGAAEAVREIPVPVEAPTSKIEHNRLYSYEVKRKLVERALEIGVTAACREQGIKMRMTGYTAAHKFGDILYINGRM